MEVLSYDPTTGVFIRKVSKTNAIKSGTIAGYIDGNGYRLIRVCGRTYKAHRLAWVYVYGRWPRRQIDHINRHRTDNRIVNIREATQLQNSRNSGPKPNNTSGFAGVSWHKATKKWMASIGNGRKIYLGLFLTPEAASAVYEAKATELFGEFKRTLTT
jgi:hypothetical protein